MHGDFRIDNTLLDLHGPAAPRVAAVVDWELSTIRDPVADVATMLAYGGPAFDLIVGGPSAWTSSRLPGTVGLATAYEAAGGVPFVDLDLHLGLARSKITVITPQGVAHRHRAGSGSGAGLEPAGDQPVAPFLEAAGPHYAGWPPYDSSCRRLAGPGEDVVISIGHAHCPRLEGGPGPRGPGAPSRGARFASSAARATSCSRSSASFPVGRGFARFPRDRSGSIVPRPGGQSGVYAPPEGTARAADGVQTAR